MYKLNAHKKYSWWMWLFIFGIVAACLLSHVKDSHAYGVTDCAGVRFGSDLGCTANDVSLTTMVIAPSTPMAYCIGGEITTADIDITVTFQNPERYDIGIFISNDGADPQYTMASGGPTSCSVSILPLTSPFMNLDSNGGVDTCGDGKNSISGVLRMTNVTFKCQAKSGSSGNLFIPYVVSWDQNKTPPGAVCTSNADPVPGTTSKCNKPDITLSQGVITTVVMPSITNSDGIIIIEQGNTTNYTVVITNKSGDTINNAVFKDPAVTYLTANSVTCTPGGGATCPASPTVSAMQGAGLTIPSMPNNGSVTFVINATLGINAPGGESLTNTASVTLSGQTVSASDTDTISTTPVGIISISPPSISKNAISPSTVVYNYTIYNRASSPAYDDISLSPTSSLSWPVSLSTSLIRVNANSSATFTLTVQVPNGISAGTIDTTTISAISGNNSSNTATATAFTTVSNAVTITPNNTGNGSKGTSVFYDHIVRNNTSSTQTVNLSTSLSGSCTGWTAAIYKSDRVTSITSVTLDPNGSFDDLDKDISVKVTIPSGAAVGSTCTVTVQAEIVGYSPASATDETTVRALRLYSDTNYTEEEYIYPVGYTVYAKAYGLTPSNRYYFKWYNSSGSLIRTSSSNNPTGGGVLTDSYPIPTTGANLGTWRVDVCLDGGSCPASADYQVYFYVGPDHVGAIYTGPRTGVNSHATINLALHAYSTDTNVDTHVVPKDPNGNLVKGNPPTTKDPLKIKVTIGNASSSATIVTTTLLNDDGSCCVAITEGMKEITGKLDGTTGTATITITDSKRSTVGITPESYNSALIGSPSRDDSASVNFRRMKIFDWREVVQ